MDRAAWQTMTGPRRVRALLVVLSLVVTGCLTSTPEPSGSPTASAPATPTPRRSSAGQTLPRGTTFAFAIEAEPTIFSPAAEDAGTRLIGRFLFTALYRLDERLLARPDLADGPPFIADDGRTWTVPLRPRIRFHDGSRLDPDDVVYTYQLARSPDCPFSELCDIARDGLIAVSAEGDLGVRFELREPDSSLLARLLSQLWIVPRDVVEASHERFIAGARQVGVDAVAALVEAVDTETNAEACLREDPPPACALAAHIDPLEAMLRRADLPLPARTAFPDGAGGIDLEAYAATLLRRVQLLGSALGSTGIDQVAAGFPLLDFGAKPVGTGMFAFVRYRPGDVVELSRFAGAVGGPAPAANVRARIITDPRIAATALKTGDIDWLPRIGPEQVSELANVAEIAIGGRPGPGIRLIVFNVRSDRVYADPVARRAFVQCLDRERAATAATGGRGDVAWVPTTPGTWAFPADTPHPAGDPDGARRALEGGGWALGTDGIYVRDGRRLSSELFVRASRGDQLDFATNARDQLHACGIELVVRELDLSGGALLDQLQWPNDFETVLVSRELGLDPEIDLAPFEGRHVTTADNPGDVNIGGWSEPGMDTLLAEARQQVDVTERAGRYADAQRILVRDVPALPLWYERAYGGLSKRVGGPERTIDLTSPGYAWDVDRWQLIGN